MVIYSYKLTQSVNFSSAFVNHSHGCLILSDCLIRLKPVSDEAEAAHGSAAAAGSGICQIGKPYNDKYGKN